MCSRANLRCLDFHLSTCQFARDFCLALEQDGFFDMLFLLLIRVKDQAEAVDEKFGVKRKLRTLADDTARKLPRVRSLDSDALRNSMLFAVPYPAETFTLIWMGHRSRHRCLCAVAEAVCGVPQNHCGESGVLWRHLVPLQHRHCLQAAQPAVHHVVGGPTVHLASHQLHEQEGKRLMHETEVDPLCLHTKQSPSQETFSARIKS